MKVPHAMTTHRELGISMTPMIDVVFLLLIFFVCTASFRAPESVLLTPLAIGSTSHASSDEVAPPLERLLIEITGRGKDVSLAINGRRLANFRELSMLLESLARIDSSLPVVFEVGAEVSVGTTIDVFDRCRMARFNNIQFAAQESP